MFELNRYWTIIPLFSENLKFLSGNFIIPLYNENLNVIELL